MTFQIDVLSAQKCSCLSLCVRTRIVVVQSDPSSVIGFPDFLENNWQTNSFLPLRIDCSALFYWYDCDMSGFSEKTGDHLLGSDSCARNFYWIWLILKHPYSGLPFTFGLIRVNSQFITCQDVIDVFRSTAIVFLDHFFRPIDTSLFLSDCVGSNANKFFYGQMFMQY